MSPFDGKWKRVSADNVDAIVSVLDKDANRKIYVNGQLKQDQTNPYGVEIDRESLLGKSKIVITKKSDNLIEINETRADGKKAKVLFAIEGNKLKLQYGYRRQYNAVNSFFTSLIAGDDKERAARLKKYLETSELVEDYYVTDSEATRNIYIDGELLHAQTVKYDVEKERTAILGKSKFVITKKSDNVIEGREEAENGLSAKAVFSVNGNNLTFEYTVENVTCTRVYEKC
ncbi:hypothetical protein LSH36_602g01012 [Paralvinella palmiformis]|uniref:Uncharacterized protein n=1 Tax=Paralvinella palmiformis TaxID=53620 RepID=A0AAD9J5N3_9ANNE|nr:hypothetical protein LSH36_602g01012 [Paralvinella palmiformis]